MSFSSQHKNNVKVIDLHQIIDNSLYVDHCHPLPEGQALVAKHVSEALKSAGIQGNQPAQISNKLYNLEQGLGNNAEFYTYFGAYAPFTRSQIQETVSQFKDYISIINKPDAAKTYLQTLPEQYSRAFDYYLKHPAFPAIKDTLDPGPKYPSDVGRFPEFYLLRYTIPYLVSYSGVATAGERLILELADCSGAMLPLSTPLGAISNSRGCHRRTQLKLPPVPSHQPRR